MNKSAYPNPRPSGKPEFVSFQVLGQPVLPMDANKTKHYHLQNYPVGLRLGREGKLMKNLWLIILVAGLGAGCGKKENADAGNPGAAAPKPPPNQPEMVEKTKPAEPKPNPTAIKPQVTEKPKPTPPAKNPQPLPPALVAAWEKAGFVAGWMGPHKEFGYISFSERLKELDVSKALPAFRLGERKPEVLEPLPTPTSAFVLVLSGTELTDAGVAELKKALPKCEIHR